MELRDFFAGNWRALILVPAVTAIIAGALFVTSVDERYESSGVVSIAEYLGGGTPAEVRASIDDFDSALQSRQVLALVAEASPSSETFRITTETIGEGGDVRVLFESATQASAEGALDAGVREALILCRSRRVDRPVASSWQRTLWPMMRHEISRTSRLLQGLPTSKPSWRAAAETCSHFATRSLQRLRIRRSRISCPPPWNSRSRKSMSSSPSCWRGPTAGLVSTSQ